MSIDSRPPTDPASTLDVRFRAAIHAVSSLDADPQIRPSTNPAFGDYQANAAMSLAKVTKGNPRELANALAACVDLTGIAEPAVIAGPGFLNIRLESAFIVAMLSAMDNATLGIEPTKETHAAVVDLCGVNVAKQMHVGHLRATIIGDTIARVFERLGRKVWRENHLGDWGLPIAMTLAALRRSHVDLDQLSLTHLNDAYRRAQLEGRHDDAGLAAARATDAGPHRLFELLAQEESAGEAIKDAKSTLLRLQGGDTEVVAAWQKIIDCTMREVYDSTSTLNAKVTAEHNRGESFFRDRLAPVVDAFLQAGFAKEDKGAIIVPFADRERPLLIRKSDGGFLYATTDLAALRFRTHDLDGSRVIYVVDARQRDHFKDVFDAAALIGWDRTKDGNKSEITHLGFGTVLGKDKRPLKTRSGENFTLKDLLDEAMERGVAEVTRRAEDPHAPTHGMPTADLTRIGRAVGIAAIKYADLSNDLTKDYVFDLDRMVAFEGDTGPYLQYAHARIANILAKSKDSASEIAATPHAVAEPAERALALHLLRYPQMVQDVARTLETNRIGAYLRTLAECFNAFYQSCPVLKSEDTTLRRARLRLCALARHVLQDGLSLYGIDAPERM
ncbi:MAG: arginine--tRNA ligase [Phycisphaerales bacterium]|nr:arginine--tRNA ligase [Phycisphaerales bacterium]